MDEITVILWVGALVGLILQYKLRVLPICLISEGLAVGGLVQAIEEYNAGTINEWPATVFIILMVAVMIWSIWNSTQVWGKGGKK